MGGQGPARATRSPGGQGGSFRAASRGGRPPPPPVRLASDRNRPTGARALIPPGSTATAVVVVSPGRCRLLTSCLPARAPLAPAARSGTSPSYARRALRINAMPAGLECTINPTAACRGREDLGSWLRIKAVVKWLGEDRRSGAPKGCRETLPLVALGYWYVPTAAWG